MAAIPVVAQC